MDDNTLLRYSRQIMLPEIDIAGQEMLVNAHVAIIGVGGLGCPAALYLSAAGVGELTLMDHDEVDLSNLQRQIAHTQASIGENKAQSAVSRIHAINQNTKVNAVPEPFNTHTGLRHLTHSQVVLDCTDNFTTRCELAEFCWQHKLTLVSGAAIRWEAQLSTFDSKQSNSPCYRCLFPSDTDENLNCADNGVIAPLVGIVGAVQALEAIKCITAVGENLVGRVQHFDAKYMDWRSFTLNKNPNCPQCGT